VTNQSGPEPRFLHEIVERAAAHAPADLALAFGGQMTTFGELHGRIERLAAALGRRVEPGERIAIVAPNTPAWIELYYAAPRAGVALGFVNHRLAPTQIRDAITALEPSVLFAGSTELAALGNLGAGDIDLAPLVVELGAGDGYEQFVTEGAGRGAPNRPTDPNETAWLIATSGTSGLPKQVALSHANLLAAVRVTAATRPTRPDDVYAFPFPLCHVAGYNALQFHYHGRPIVLLTRFDAADFVRLAEEHAVTTTSLAPTMIHDLVEHLEATGHRLPTMRSISYGSGPIAPPLLVRTLGLLDVDLQQGYGMTELAGNAVFLGGDEHRHAASDEPKLLHAAGKPGPGVEVRIVDEAGAPVPTGTAGEIAIRGPQVMRGYWRAPEANADAFVDGWFRTGDVGRFDDDGYLYVVDRKKDIIITGGENVSSREVEDLLAAHPSVREVAVVGVPDARWGEAVCAVVVPVSGAVIEPAHIVDYARDAIGGFKKPRHAMVVDELPRNASGKVLKTEVRALAAASLVQADPATPAD